MVQNKRNTDEIVDKLAVSLAKLETKVFKIFIELDKLKQAVEQQQAMIAGPLKIFADHQPEFERLLSTGFLQSVNEEVAQNKRHIEALADEIVRDKLDKAIDEASDKVKDAVLEKIEKQSALW